MAAKDNYSFELVGNTDPSTPVKEAVPPAIPESYYDETDPSDNPSDAAVIMGCGLLGCLVAGPLLAIVAALGGKYAADKHQGLAGDASRSMGRIAAAAGEKAKEERLLCKVKDSARSSLGSFLDKYSGNRDAASN